VFSFGVKMEVRVSITSQFEPYDRFNVIHNTEEWDHFIGVIVKGNREAADSLGMVLFELLRAMSEGPDGFLRSLNTVKLGLERLFPFTTTHKSSFMLFLYELEGLLGELPAMPIAPLIERAEASARKVAGAPPLRPPRPKRKRKN
jgi:hypothetical protein